MINFKKIETMCNHIVGLEHRLVQLEALFNATSSYTGSEKLKVVLALDPNKNNKNVLFHSSSLKEAKKIIKAMIVVLEEEHQNAVKEYQDEVNQNNKEGYCFDQK